MNDIGIVASAAYVPRVLRPLPELLVDEAAPPSGRAARFLRTCFEETLQIHGITVAALRDARQQLNAAAVEAATGVASVAEEPLLEVSEMLLHVARPLLEAPEGAGAPPVSTFMVCHTSLENDFTISAACRLQAELRQGQVPFAVGQLQGATFLMALSLAADLVAGGHGQRIAIAAAERWTPPFTRLLGQSALLGDGAGAVLLERGCSVGWMLRSIRVSTPPPTGEIFRHVMHGTALPLNIDTLAELVAETLDEAACRPEDIAVLVPHEIRQHLTDQVRRRCGLRSAWCGPADILDGGYLCAAEAPVRLHRLLQCASARPGDRMLLWAVGLEGAVACAVLEYAEGVVRHDLH